MSEDLPLTVFTEQGLRLVDMAHAPQWSAMKPELVARAVTGLEKVNISNRKFTQQQAGAVLKVVFASASAT